MLPEVRMAVTCPESLKQTRVFSQRKTESSWFRGAWDEERCRFQQAGKSACETAGRQTWEV